MNTSQRKKWDKLNSLIELPVFENPDLSVENIENIEHIDYIIPSLIKNIPNQIQIIRIKPISKWRLKSRKNNITNKSINYEKKTKKQMYNS